MATDKKYPENKKKRVRKATLKRKYGLTPQQFDLMVWEQNNKCAICFSEMTNPHVDHDHSCCPGKDTCGKCIRALLCTNCNTSLGGFKDSQELLLRAVSYLDSFQKKEPL